MDKSVPTAGNTVATDSTKPMATYMPSLGSPAPLFIKSSAVFDYAMSYHGNKLPRVSPTNPPVTPWDDTDDERGLSPARSPVNMLLATDLTEVVNGRASGAHSTARWPYLKQQAARHVYGNLRSRLQNRDLVSPPAVSMTYSSGEEFINSMDGIQVQTFGIKPKSDPGPAEEARNLRPQSPKDVKQFEKKKNYRISFKLSNNDQRSCVSAPPPTAESTVSKRNSSEGSQTKPQHSRRSKTAREHYRPKKDPLVKFDSMELPKSLWQNHRLPSSSSLAPPHVTWTDVIAAKSDGVYRDSFDGLSGPTRQRNGSKVKLYLSSELWGILDEDIGAIKTVASNS